MGVRSAVRVLPVALLAIAALSGQALAESPQRQVTGGQAPPAWETLIKNEPVKGVSQNAREATKGCPIGRGGTTRPSALSWLFGGR